MLIRIEEFEFVDDFEEYLRSIIPIENYDTSQPVVIVLPGSLNPLERDALFNLASYPDFRIICYVNHLSDLVIEITLSRKYISKLFKKKERVLPQDVFKDFKQIYLR